MSDPQIQKSFYSTSDFVACAEPGEVYPGCGFTWADADREYEAAKPDIARRELARTVEAEAQLWRINGGM